MAAKYCIVNHCKVADFLRVLLKFCFKGQGSQVPSGFAIWNRPYSGPIGFDIARFARWIGEPVPVLRSQFVRRYMPNAALSRAAEGWSSEASEHRWCRECLARGFHSVLFEIPWLEKCPIHTCRLTLQFVSREHHIVAERDLPASLWNFDAQQALSLYEEWRGKGENSVTGRLRPWKDIQWWGDADQRVEEAVAHLRAANRGAVRRERFCIPQPQIDGRAGAKLGMAIEANTQRTPVFLLRHICCVGRHVSQHHISVTDDERTGVLKLSSSELNLLRASRRFECQALGMWPLWRRVEQRADLAMRKQHGPCEDLVSGLRRGIQPFEEEFHSPAEVACNLAFRGLRSCRSLVAVGLLEAFGLMELQLLAAVQAMHQTRRVAVQRNWPMQVSDADPGLLEARQINVRLRGVGMFKRARVVGPENAHFKGTGPDPIEEICIVVPKGPLAQVVDAIQMNRSTTLVRLVTQMGRCMSWARMNSDWNGGVERSIAMLLGSLTAFRVEPTPDGIRVLTWGLRDVSGSQAKGQSGGETEHHRRVQACLDSGLTAIAQMEGIGDPVLWRPGLPAMI